MAAPVTRTSRRQHPGAARCVPAIVLTVLAGPAIHSAIAQVYPVKPVRIIMPLSAGGPNDFVARTLAQHFTAALGQQFIVETRPGAGGTIGATAAAKAPADGHTLMFASTTTLSISPSLYANPGYDPLTSFAPITNATSVDGKSRWISSSSKTSSYGTFASASSTFMWPGMRPATGWIA